MSLKLMYITNDINIASIAEKNGVDRIWIDLEKNGKEQRQKGLNTVKSNHTLQDVSAMYENLKRAELMVRINPLFEGSREEIEEVIARGAKVIMLPMFKTTDEVETFVRLVSGRIKTMLLVETKEAAEIIEKIVKIPGIDEIHIGLNDLHLSYNMRFMFEPLAYGMVDRLCKIIGAEGIPYGFGGVSRLNDGLIPGRYIIAEHYRLGSSRAILSRSFCDTWTDKNYKKVYDTFESGMKELRDYEQLLMGRDKEFYDNNQRLIKKMVAEIVEQKMINA